MLDYASTHIIYDKFQTIPSLFVICDNPKLYHLSLLYMITTSCIKLHICKAIMICLLLKLLKCEHIVLNNFMHACLNRLTS